VLAAGGLAPDHSRWIFSRRSFLPIKVLSRVFRGKSAESESKQERAVDTERNESFLKFTFRF
jgi:hypothetical protein